MSGGAIRRALLLLGLALGLVSCNPPGDDLLIGCFRSQRATFVELAEMFARHPETRVATPTYATVTPPSATGPVPIQVVPGWSRAELEEHRLVGTITGDPTTVVALEHLPGWSPGEIARFKGLFARIRGLMYIEKDRRGAVMFFLYNKRSMKHRSTRFIAHVVDESAAVPLVGSIEDSDSWSGADVNTGRWIGYRKLEPQWYLGGMEQLF